MAQIKLPAEVAQKYELVNYGTGSHRQRWGKYGIIDVNELTLEKADRLHKAGWPKLKLKPAAAKAAAEDAGDGKKKS